MLIKNVRIITWNQNGQIIENGAVEIADGKIAKVYEKWDQAGHPEADGFDGKQQILMPGNICAHTHFYGAFSRGMPLQGFPAQSFPEILKNLWWPLDKSLDAESIRLSAQLCIIDAVRHGTTTLFDHHASQNAIIGSLEAIADVVKEAGVRADLCYEVTDRDGQGARDDGIRENINFLNSIARDRSGVLSAHFGLHASLTLSESTLDKVRESAPGEVGFHIHVAEHSCDEYDCVNQYGMRIIERLEKHHLLNERTIVAHGVYLDTNETQKLMDRGVWLSHQPRSNMNNGVGLADIESILDAGIKVVMGNDGFSNSMWDEWKVCYLAHKLWNKDPRKLSADKVIRIGIDHNRELADQSFPKNRFGVIEEGAAADLILIDYAPFTALTSGNLPWHILFGFRESMVTSTIVNGKFLMRDGQLLTLDEEKIIAHALEKYPQVWKKYTDQFKK